MDKAKAAGIQVIEIADKTPFQDAVKPVWDKYGPKYAETDQAHPGGEVSHASTWPIRSRRTQSVGTRPGLA